MNMIEDRDKWTAARWRLEALVDQVAAQLIALPLPAPTATSGDVLAWAYDRSRNILAGLAGESL
jgi:hypothetical protein